MDILQFLTLSVLIDVAAGTALTTKLPVIDDTPWHLYKAVFCPNATTAVDAANYADIQVLASDGTTVIADWSTLTTADGALTDGVPANLAFTGDAGAVFYGAEHQVIVGNSAPTSPKVKVVHTGTGAAIDGRLVVILKRGQRTQARS
ncbi:MAG: streptogramin lyase [Myxococcota bacterium]|jgi:streptogramin lyase